MVKKKKAGVSQKNAQNVEEQTHLRNRDSILLFLERSYKVYNRVEFIETDPIFFPTSYKGDKEYVAFVSALFAYGRVNLIKDFLIRFFDYYGNDPFNNIVEENRAVYYRFQTSKDIFNLYVMISEIYEKYGSIEGAFLFFSDKLEEALRRFVLYCREFGQKRSLDRGFFQLFPDPESSGLKRFRMFLRWMIRKDEIDFGLWKNFDRKDLIYPIDTHILRFAYKNGIVSNETNSLKNALKITEFFRVINSSDPLKYDFTLTRLGMVNHCKFKKDYNCEFCTHVINCPFC
ncbi:MAG: TIGR02757 family protein [Calditerrivibrio nitroreducens]|uniref:TIGR02757 family protein n=1 Tax=Calditerrivibrio nitroreducens TaxID=477976 RepID=A0A2J6WMA8_9BACT|nr:MAG: TIGR02757 family protein [Calditerrivibrio nitroreducens]